MKTCSTCQWFLVQHSYGSFCRRVSWGGPLNAQVGYAYPNDPACPEWTGENTEGETAMRERVKELEAAAENDVFIIKRQTERIEGLKAELQAAYDLLAEEKRHG